jgi:putative ABC transport system ATP-binding protein
MTGSTSGAVIRFSGVSYAFGTGRLRRQVLFDLAGAISAGEIVIVEGPSGSGKTTLLTLLGALRDPQEGAIDILGRRLDGAARRVKLEIRRKIGFVFQQHNLIDALTATQNLLMALRLHPEIADPVETAHRALAATGLEQCFDLYPRQLSVGQRQRVAVARALVARPQVVLADEPTAALDSVTGRAVVTHLRQLANEQGTAVLLVTHDVRILDIADRIVTLQDGRFVGTSGPSQPALADA